MRYLAGAVAVIGLALSACEVPAPTGIEAEEATALLSRAAPSCGNLKGSIEASFVSGEAWDIEAQLFDLAGNSVGHGFAWIDALEPHGEGAPGEGAIHADLRHHYVIGGSDLYTEDRGVLSPIAPPLFAFNNRLEVTGGTGAFDGATGMLRAHGTVDLGSGEIHLSYHGRVCR